MTVGDAPPKVTRTGRIDEARLQQEFPRFMGRYREEWAAFKQTPRGQEAGGVNPSTM